MRLSGAPASAAAPSAVDGVTARGRRTQHGRGRDRGASGTRRHQSVKEER
ncbi:uncharacterized protein V6R79_007088 [Siganus canaliculatus]